MPGQNYFDIPAINPDELSPAVWAYIGDAVYELFIRCHLLAGGPAKTKTLHHEAISMVRASFQANLAGRIEPFLTEAEVEVLKRGRNVKSGHIPPGTDVLTYRHSTAFEALIGYLYLSGQQARLTQLLKEAVKLNEVKERSN
ncbi:MAG: Mini-ribonuclease 3 [Bacillota bacterium]